MNAKVYLRRNFVLNLGRYEPKKLKDIPRLIADALHIILMFLSSLSLCEAVSMKKITLVFLFISFGWIGSVQKCHAFFPCLNSLNFVIGLTLIFFVFVIELPLNVMK